jgi:hypothetical protein
MAKPQHNANAAIKRGLPMDFEEQLLIGGLLMTIAVLSASHAHASPVAARIVRTTTTLGAAGQHEARCSLQESARKTGAPSATTDAPAVKRH